MIKFFANSCNLLVLCPLQASRLGESGESGGAFEPSTVQAHLMIDPKTEPGSGVFIK